MYVSLLFAQYYVWVMCPNIFGTNVSNFFLDQEPCFNMNLNFSKITKKGFASKVLIVSVKYLPSRRMIKSLTHTSQ